VGGLGLLIAAIFVIWGNIGYNAFRSSLLAAVDRQGRALLESLIQSTEVTAQANQFMRLQQIRNLADQAELLAARTEAGELDSAALAALPAQQDVDGVVIIDARDRRFAEPPEVISFLDAGDADIAAALENIRSGLTPWETVYRTDSADGEEWIGSLVGGKQGSVYSAWRKVTRIEEVFREIGIGRLIQMVGQKAGIDYIILQTPDGILFASRDVKPVLRIANDPFLMEAVTNNQTATREFVFEGREVLEAVQPFISEHVADGILRVGVSLHAVQQAADRLKQQLLISSIFLGLLTIAAVGFVIVRQNLQTVSRSYQQISTLTGRILDAMDGAVVAVNEDGRITHFNPAAEVLFGLPAGEVIGRPAMELFPGDEVGLRAVAADGIPLRSRELVRAVDGKQQFLSLSVAPIRHPGGKPGGAVAVIVDLTDARRMTERIRRAERLSELGTMAAGVAHEVRNPLNAIGLAAQRLSLEFEVTRDEDEFQQFTGSIISETRRLDKIINEFLDLARSPRETPRRFGLTAVIDEVTALFKLEAGEKNIDLQVSGQPGLELMGIPGELKKAVINILSNAIAATPAGGTIAVTYGKTSADHEVFLRITDTGEGIPAEDRDKIFQPYFTTKARGTGLGLAITARIIADFGGTIDIEPNPGGGTIVEVRLPPA
jgi:PAS domain S-box-containing protein